MKVLILNTRRFNAEVLDFLKYLLNGLDLGFEMPERECENIFDFEGLGINDVLLVLIEDALDQDEKACLAVRNAARNGIRIIGVWPPGYSNALLPAILNRTGSGALPFNRAALGNALCRGAKEIWLMPDGSRRPEQPFRRGSRQV